MDVESVFCACAAGGYATIRRLCRHPRHHGVHMLLYLVPRGCFRQSSSSICVHFGSLLALEVRVSIKRRLRRGCGGVNLLDKGRVVNSSFVAIFIDELLKIGHSNSNTQPIQFALELRRRDKAGLALVVMLKKRVEFSSGKGVREGLSGAGHLLQALSHAVTQNVPFKFEYFWGRCHGSDRTFGLIHFFPSARANIVCLLVGRLRVSMRMSGGLQVLLCFIKIVFHGYQTLCVTSELYNFEVSVVWRLPLREELVHGQDAVFVDIVFLKEGFRLLTGGE